MTFLCVIPISNLTSEKTQSVLGGPPLRLADELATETVVLSQEIAALEVFMQVQTSVKTGQVKAETRAVCDVQIGINMTLTTSVIPL